MLGFSEQHRWISSLNVLEAIDIALPLSLQQVRRAYLMDWHSGWWEC
jgi:hypothetical protein